jgi:hypothetical protein
MKEKIWWIEKGSTMANDFFVMEEEQEDEKREETERIEREKRERERREQEERERR